MKPKLIGIFFDGFSWVGQDEDGVEYFGPTRLAVLRAYQEEMARLEKSAQTSGFSLAELRALRALPRRDDRLSGPTGHFGSYGPP
jgi:hypothetical protein